MTVETRLRGLGREGREAPVPTPDLEPVLRRARALRVRKAIGAGIAACVLIAAVALPLVSLGGLIGGSDRSDVAMPDGTYLAFAPADGWTSLTSGGQLPETGGHSALASTIPLVTADTGPKVVDPEGRLLQWLIPTDTMRALPPEGILITAGTLFETKNPLVPSEDFPLRTLPLRLSDARVSTSFESQPAPNVPEYALWSTVNGRYLDVHIYFGRPDPTPGQLAMAQAELDRLIVPPAPPTTDRLDQFGISLPLPDGWSGRLYGQSVTGPATLEVSTVPLENWPSRLPGGKALGPKDVSISLVEADGLNLDYQRVSLPISIGEGDRCDGCPPFGESDPAAPAGHAFYFRTFETAVRWFELSVEFGSAEPGPGGLDTANRVLAGLRIDPLPTPPLAVDVGTAGITMAVPTGWDALALPDAKPSSPSVGAELVASTASIPGHDISLFDRASMAPGDVLLQVFELPGGSSEQVPPLSSALSVDRSALCTLCEEGSIQGHWVWATRFGKGGRTFSVHVQFGSRPSSAALDEVDRILASFRVIDTTPSPVAVGDGIEVPRPATYADPSHAISLPVPAGWWAKSRPLNATIDPRCPSRSERGTSRGGGCGPTAALKQLPHDAAFVWISEVFTPGSAPATSNPGRLACASSAPPRGTTAARSCRATTGDPSARRYRMRRSGVRVTIGHASANAAVTPVTARTSALSSAGRSSGRIANANPMSTGP
jgi:hypothetical protein